MAPAGSINSSVSEMSNWLITWINKGKFEDKEILSESYINEAMSAQMVVSGGLPDEEFPDMHSSNYGYGWFLSSYRGHYRVEHGGNIDGFSANVAFFPSDSIGIVVLANQNGSAVPTLVRNTIADILLESEQTDWADHFKTRMEKAKKESEEAKANSTSSKVPNTRPSHILQDYTGSYEHPGYGTFQINANNDSLFAEFKLMTFYLRHYHYDIFEPFRVTDTGIDTSEWAGLRFNFETNNNGEISRVNVQIEATIDPIAFKHTPNNIEVDKETLERYAGEYELSGTTIKVSVKNESKLYLYVAGQPEYELMATDKHKFSFKSLEGFKVVFVESEDGAINEMTLIQPNGTFKTTRK